jgi:RNA polymerase sigma-70 factor (sigma-E family)
MMQQIAGSKPFKYWEVPLPSFEEFAETRGQSLTRLAFLLCGDQHLADDLTQSTLAKVYRKWSRISVLEFPEAYTRRVMVREYASWRRRRAASEIVVESPSDVPLAPATQDDHAELVVEVDAVWRLLGTLPPRQRAVLVLRYYLDQDDHQVAETLGCSTSTVRSNAARALQSLRLTHRVNTEEVTS